MAEIREAVLEDVPGLLPLMNAYWVFEGIPGYDPAQVATQLQRLLSEPKLGCVWVAHDGGLPVGYLVAVYVFSLEHLGLTAEIDECFVQPEYRGRGIGSDLLRRAEIGVMRAGCTSISLQLGVFNESGHQFYLKHDFVKRAGYNLLDKQLSIV